MALIAPVVDGKIQETTAQKNTASATEDGSTLGKDAFLQLLVAQMKYQDPLEPTSNTEYISQLATFSELEQMQNLSSNMEMQRASALVGKEVYMKTSDTENGTGFKAGRVDYVVLESGKAYLSIEEKLYALEDLDTIVDEDYQEAVDIASDFAKRMNQLPKYENITLDYKEDVMKLKETYDNMTKYQKSFVATDYKTKLDKFVSRIEEIEKAKEDKEEEKGEEDEKGDTAEGTEKA